MAGTTHSKRNLAASVGAWSSRHRKLAVASWLLFVVLAMLIGQALGTVKHKDGASEPGDAGRADRIIAAAGFHDHASEAVLVQSSKFTARNPEFKAAVNETIAAIKATSKVESVRSPLDAAKDAGAVSGDGHSALIQFDIPGDTDAANGRVQPVLDAVAGVQRTHPELRIEEFGDASSNKALNAALGDDLSRAEVLSLPITLIILFFVFGALVAAVLPVGLAITAFLAAAGLLAPFSRLIHTDETASTVMLLVGMAVGVDYSLFYLAANARSAGPAIPSRNRSPLLPAHPGGRSSSRDSPSSSPWQGCSWPGTRRSQPSPRRPSSLSWWQFSAR